MNTKDKNTHITSNIICSRFDSEEDIFKKIYDRNLWQSKYSASGKGSEYDNTKNILKSLPELFTNLRIKTIIDAPCGDYFWMKELKYTFEKYTGVDIVEKLTENNRKHYGSSNIEFKCLDLIKTDLPAADLILCRDCFIHLPFDKIFAILNNFKKSGSKYLMTTTYKNTSVNENIYTGGFRKINLEKEPFNFPPAEIEINETEDKFLSLWRISNL